MADAILTLDPEFQLVPENLDPAIVYAGTIRVGSVEVLPAEAAPTVNNSGTVYAAVLDFGFPDAVTPANEAAAGANLAASAANNAAISASEAEAATEIAELARVISEGDRDTAEQGRATTEGLRVTAEEDRETAESGRVIAEGNRVTADGGRTVAEGGRVLTEASRVTAEGLRVTAEEGRVTAEGLRVIDEGSRVTSEGLRVTAEGGRVIAEGVRVSNESGRVGTYENLEAATAAAMNELYNMILTLQDLYTAMTIGTAQIDTLNIVTALNIFGTTNLILTGIVAPAVIPSFVGQMYVNTSAGTCYQSKGTASVSDWKQTA